MSNTLKAPILLLAYKRPEHTAKVLESIQGANPSSLYISMDGPRPGRKGDVELCARTRALISAFNPGCEIRVQLHEQNLGCKKAVIAGLDWFFSHEEEGIVLEDDVVPVPCFYRYCEELLERYRDDERIGAICGSRFLFDDPAAGDSYFFSRLCFIWGWASWRRVWRTYDPDIKDWPQARHERRIWRATNSFRATVYWTLVLNGMYGNKNDIWGYQWQYNLWQRNQLSIIPNRHLVRNIGMGSVEGTHSRTRNRAAEIPLQSMDWPLAHPSVFLPDTDLERKLQRNYYKLWKEIAVQMAKKLKLLP
jgi:hypothetical protein